ncbi:MAG: hypothetical protein AAF570_10535 [Bacteroidota bacterium]
MIWSASEKAWLVSNTGGKQMLRMREGEVPEVFVPEISGPMGLCIVAETLFVANGADGDPHILGFYLATGQEIWRAKIPGAKQLNDLVTDERGHLYVTDRMTDKIYVVDLASRHYGLLSADKIPTPNGLLYDARHHRLLVCNSVDAPALYTISLPGGFVQKRVDVPHANLDGLGRDRQGRIYVSGWGADWKQTQILRFAADLKGEPEIVLQNGKGAADIYVDEKRNVLALPYWWANDVEIVPVEKLEENGDK